MVCYRDVVAEEPLYMLRTKLLEQILSANLYDPEVNPQVNSTTPVTVTLQFSLDYILEVVSLIVIVLS